MTDFQSLYIGLEAAEAFASFEKVCGGGSDLQVQRSLPSLEAGPVAIKLAFPIPLGWRQVAQWVVDVVCSVPKVDKYVLIQIQPTKCM